MSLDRPGPGPGPVRLPKKKSTQSLVATGEPRLSVIAEDGDAPSQDPKSILRPHHRPFSRIWNIGYPPRPSYEKSPPDYSSLRDVPPTKMERLKMNVRSNKYVARRGGWKRLLCITILVIALILGLAVGLTVGLRNRNSPSTPVPSPATSQNTTSTGSGPFPLGTYSLNTFLDTASTDCTSNAATWRCYPYTTYAESPSGALSTFVWVITGTMNNYLISSTSNPFAISFSDVPLNLVDANTSTEHYTFSVPILKIVVPSAAITADNSMAACDYNNTNFQANLYTRMPGTYMQNSTAPPAASASAGTGTASGTVIQPWPYAVEVDQSIGGGANVPDCYEVINGNPGARVTNGLEPQPAGSICNCTYKNFDP